MCCDAVEFYSTAMVQNVRHCLYIGGAEWTIIVQSIFVHARSGVDSFGAEHAALFVHTRHSGDGDFTGRHAMVVNNHGAI